MKFSIVIPLYKCSKSILELYNRLVSSIDQITNDFEIIFVNDASPENDWEIVKELAAKDIRVIGINFSRNFGQHYAITAGLDFAKGDWIVVMDGDLQDQPEEILKLYNKALEGFDVVLGQRLNRKDKYFKRFFSFIYYKLLSYLTDTKIDSSVGTFRILSKQVVFEYNKMREYYRFFGSMINWLGFNTAYLPIKHNERTFGVSSYSFKKAFKLAITGALSFSDKPLKLTIKFGILIVFFSSLYIFYKLANILLYGTSAIGWSSLIASIFFSTGIIVTILGMIGLYIGRIFEQVKQRPLYIIKQTTKSLIYE